MKDTKTLAYILKRTNYGEADRILNLITPEGKIAAIAKAARKQKSKLAGGIELFSLVELNLHQGKSDFAIVTSARMVNFFGNIMKEYGRMELAGLILKKINRIAEHSDNSEYFMIVDQCLHALDNGEDTRLIKSWFVLNCLKARGEETNLYRDVNGERLAAGVNYDWDVQQEAFTQSSGGKYGSNEIKLLRLISTNDLRTVTRVKLTDDLMGRITDFIAIVGDS